MKVALMLQRSGFPVPKAAHSLLLTAKGTEHLLRPFQSEAGGGVQIHKPCVAEGVVRASSQGMLITLLYLAYSNKKKNLKI